MRYLFLILLISVSAQAQQKLASDSIFIYHQAAHELRSLKWGPTQLIAHKLEKASSIGLIYNLQDGSFREAQQAAQTRKASFSAEGISSIDRFKLYGHFSFTKTWQDSLAFSQKGIEEAYSPYYYIAGKAGNFQRQTYVGGGIVSYQLVKDKLFLGTGIDYLYHTSARAVDPRSSVTTYRLKFNPTVTYKLNQHAFGLGVELGYGDESISIHYKNDDYKGGLLYPDRISNLNFGYGTLETSQASFTRKNKYSGLNMNYAIHSQSWNFTSKIAYQISNEENRYPREALTDQTFGIYQVESLSAQFLLNKSIGKTLNQFQLTIRQDNGDDHLIRAAARNYTYAGSDVNFGYSNYHLTKNNVGVEWMAKLAYRENYQRDAGADHTIRYHYVRPNLGAAFYWKRPNKDLLVTAFGLGARLPLANEIRVPLTQVNDFTQGVAYPDYLYWASKVGEARLKLTYSTNTIFHKFRTGVSLNAAYLHRLALPAYDFVPTSVPGKQHLDINCSLNLYF